MSLISKSVRKIASWLTRHKDFQRQFRQAVIDPFVPAPARNALEQGFAAALAALRKGDYLGAAEAFGAVAALLRSLAK